MLSIILGGGAGSRLYPLTKMRAKPAVPLGANYRLIDIPVSNCLNSNITKIYCLTQYNSASLNRHLSQVRCARLMRCRPPLLRIGHASDVAVRVKHRDVPSTSLAVLPGKIYCSGAAVSIASRIFRSMLTVIAFECCKHSSLWLLPSCPPQLCLLSFDAAFCAVL